MKNRHWALLFCLLALILAAISLLLGSGSASGEAAIYVDGALYRTVSLDMPQEFTVESAHGSNTVRISDGKIAVIRASCPDLHCVRQGAKNSGTPIICLPNRLVIRFTEQSVDAQSG